MSFTCLNTEPNTSRHKAKNYRGGDCQQPVKVSRAPSRHLCSQRELFRLISQPTQDLLKFLHFRIWLTCFVPQVVVVHFASSIASFSRRSFIPRCKFTRTDAGVRPVRAAISGPV